MLQGGVNLGPLRVVQESGVEINHLYDESHLVDDTLASGLLFGPQFEVGPAVIRSLPIFVVRRLGLEQRTSDDLRQNVTVFKDTFTVDSDMSISVYGNKSRAWGTSARIGSADTTMHFKASVVHGAESSTDACSCASVNQARETGRFLRSNDGRTGVPVEFVARVMPVAKPFCSSAKFAARNTTVSDLSLKNKFDTAGVAMRVTTPQVSGTETIRAHRVWASFDAAFQPARFTVPVLKVRRGKNLPAAVAGLWPVGVGFWGWHMGSILDLRSVIACFVSFVNNVFRQFKEVIFSKLNEVIRFVENEVCEYPRNNSASRMAALGQGA